MKRQFHHDLEISDLMFTIFLKSLEGVANDKTNFGASTIVNNAWNIAREAAKMIEQESLDLNQPTYG